MMLYKCLDKTGQEFGYGQGKRAWLLPNDEPAAWMPRVDGPLVLYKNGYDLARKEQLIDALSFRIFEAESRGDSEEVCVNGVERIMVREARLARELRWDETTARLFAADCAEHTLAIFLSCCPDDSRVENAIQTARAFAQGASSKTDLEAAWLAADRAASAAIHAGDAAAYDAAKAAQSAAEFSLLGFDAKNTASKAASAAARAASPEGVATPDETNTGIFRADPAPWDRERAWQTQRLFEYLGRET